MLTLPTEWFALLHFVIGLENSRHSLNQSDTQLKQSPFWFAKLKNSVNSQVKENDSNDFIDVISYEVANYGMGGHYEPHHDFLQVSRKSSLID